jgi:hypothetical protein
MAMVEFNHVTPVNEESYKEIQAHDMARAARTLTDPDICTIVRVLWKSFESGALRPSLPAGEVARALPM